MAKSRNTARNKAARALQADNPGMRYTEALRETDKAHVLAQLKQSLDRWDDIARRADRVGTQVANEPQPRVHPDVWARMDADGLLTELTVTPQALTEHSAAQLGLIVTEVLQSTFDYVLMQVMSGGSDTWDIDAGPVEEAAVFTVEHRSGLTVTVDRRLRPVRCDIEPGAISAGVDLLARRIARICRNAQEDAFSSIRGKFAIALIGDTADWRPDAETARYVPHTWLAGWHEGGVEALVAEAAAAAWECLVIESTSNGPITVSARDQIRTEGAEVVGPDSDEIAARLAELDDDFRRRREARLDADRRPLLVLVGDGDHVLNEVMGRILRMGRELDMHLAIDERARERTDALTFDVNVGGIYRIPESRCAVK